MSEKAAKGSHTAAQDICIHYCDIGMRSDVNPELDIPSPEAFDGTDDEIFIASGL